MSGVLRVVTSTSPKARVRPMNMAMPRAVGAGKYSRVRTWLRSWRFGMTSSTMNSMMTGAARRRPGRYGLPLVGR